MSVPDPDRLNLGNISDPGDKQSDDDKQRGDKNTLPRDASVDALASKFTFESKCWSAPKNHPKNI